MDIPISSTVMVSCIYFMSFSVSDVSFAFYGYPLPFTCFLFHVYFLVYLYGSLSMTGIPKCLYLGRHMRALFGTIRLDGCYCWESGRAMHTPHRVLGTPHYYVFLCNVIFEYIAFLYFRTRFLELALAKVNFSSPYPFGSKASTVISRYPIRNRDSNQW